MALVSIDTSALSFPLYLIPGQTPDFVDGSAAPAINLSPGDHSFQQASGVITLLRFTVTSGGTVDFDPSMEGFLGGRGSDTLIVRGYEVKIDGTALSHGLLPVIAGGNTFLMPDDVHELVLVPSPVYLFQPASGIVANFSFAVELDGTVSVPVEFDGFAAAVQGGLRITGYAIQIDGTSLSHDLLPVVARVNNTFLARSQVNTLTLIPGAGYVFQPGAGIVADFLLTLEVDGGIDAETARQAVGAGATALVAGTAVFRGGAGAYAGNIKALRGTA